MTKEFILKTLNADEADRIMGVCIDDPTKKIICIWNKGYTSIRIPYEDKMTFQQKNIEDLFNDMQTADQIIIQETSSSSY